jgi:hypothetical protein
VESEFGVGRIFFTLAKQTEKAEKANNVIETF